MSSRGRAKPLARWRVGALAIALIAAVMSTALASCGGQAGGESGSSSSGSSSSSGDVAGVRETAALLDGIPQHDLVLGKPDAPVTLVEVIDLQCPFCRKHQLDYQPELVDRLVRTGRVRIMLLPVAFLGADSQRMEVVMLRLSREGKAWQFANLVFWNQGQEGSGYATDGWLQRIVTAIPGTDPSAASTTPDEGIVAAAGQARAAAEHGIRRVGGAGTPFFMIGRTDAPLTGYTPILAGAQEDAPTIIERATARIEQGKQPKEMEHRAPAPTSGGAGTS